MATPGEHRETANIRAIVGKVPSIALIENQGLAARGSNASLAKIKQNPGALAGATGADIEGSFNLSDPNLNSTAYATELIDLIEVNAARQVTAQHLINAVLNCGVDAVPFLEIVHSVLSPDWPMPSPYANLMAEAREWARIASTAQRKGYALACFEELTPADQAAFLSHVGARVAA